MKSGTIDHPKMKMLKTVLGVPHYAAVGIMESLWHFTSVYAPMGDIGKFTNHQLAVSLNWDKEPDALVDALIACGWVELSDRFRLVIHDWADHADDAVNLRLARREQTFWCGKAPNSKRLQKKSRPDEIPQKTDNVDIAPTDSNAFPRIPTKKAPPSPKPSPKPEPVIKKTLPEKSLRAANGWFDECWSVYPKKVGKDAAQRAFKSKVDSRETVDAILSALAWQAKSEDWTKENRKFVPHFSTYLNAGRWKDTAPDEVDDRIDMNPSDEIKRLYLEAQDEDEDDDLFEAK